CRNYCILLKILKNYLVKFFEVLVQALYKNSFGNICFAPQKFFWMSDFFDSNLSRLTLVENRSGYGHFITQL
ncbi:hypothetical protein, partial [Leptospira interrogans]|uniref:hypothetical protein n=1 Tax=Leptospira interrogans TaxID=173 RepID=UPI001F3C6F40